MHLAKTIALAAFLLIACGGGGGSSQPVTNGNMGGGPTTGAPVAIAPLKLMVDKTGKVGLEVRADGSIVSGDGELIASFDGRKLVGTHSGKGVVVQDDGSITPLAGSSPDDDDMKLHFDANGDLVTSKGDKISVDANGVPSISSEGKTETLPAHIVGMTAQTHRLAVLVVFVAMMAHESKPEAATSASIGPAPSAPPPAPHP